MNLRCSLVEAGDVGIIVNDHSDDEEAKKDEEARYRADRRGSPLPDDGPVGGAAGKVGAPPSCRWPCVLCGRHYGFGV